MTYMAPMGERWLTERAGSAVEKLWGGGCLCTPAFPSFQWVLHCLPISSLPALVCLSCFLSFASKEPRPGAEGERGEVSATVRTFHAGGSCKHLTGMCQTLCGHNSSFNPKEPQEAGALMTQD